MPSQIKGSEHNFLLRKSRVFVSFLQQIGLVIHLFLFAGRVISVIGGPTVYRRFLPEPIPGDSTGAGPKKSRARRKRGRKSTNFFMPNSSARPLVPCTVIIMSSPSVSLLPPPPFIFQINKMTSSWPKALVFFPLASKDSHSGPSSFCWQFFPSPIASECSSHLMLCILSVQDLGGKPNQNSCFS